MKTLNEYLPLKQGLRLRKFSLKSYLRSLNEYLPLKQGLRHDNVTHLDFYYLNEYLPLKQGLRLLACPQKLF